MEKFECRICMETIPLDQCFKTQPFRLCFNSFCRCCIVKYIQEEISNNTANIRCPWKGACKNHILNPFEFRGFISKALFDRWCDLLCESAIRGLESCRCPNKACLEIVVDECSGVSDAQNRKITCPNCKKSCCFGCSNPWQDGHRCPRERNYLPPRNNWQRCPECSNFVPRNRGYSIIYCRCGIPFCYYCGQRCSYTRCHYCLYRRWLHASPRRMLIQLVIVIFILLLLLALVHYLSETCYEGI